MWISRDLSGFVTLWEKKPVLDDGVFVSRRPPYGESYDLGYRSKLEMILKRGECRRVKLKILPK